MRSALITGGGAGLGREIGQALLDMGIRVYVIDRRERERVDSAYLARLHGYHNTDLADLNALIRTIGSDSLPAVDILVNNASPRLFMPYSDFLDKQIDQYLDVAIRANLLLTQELSKAMASRNFGRIINIVSRAGFYGYSTGSLYCATKGFLLRFTEAIAKDFEYAKVNVTANSICPNSLTDNHGVPDGDYEKKIRRIIRYVRTIISSRVNGRCYNTFTIKESMYYLYKTGRALL